MARLAVARLHFCSNSFNAHRTRLEDLADHEWRSGEEALEHAAEGSELDGLRTFLADRPDWEATLLRCASAPPGGPLHSEVFGAWLSDVESGLRGGRFDAVYLSLHGACQAEGDPAADLTVMRRIRAIIGRIPMVASFDSAANLSDEVPLLLDGSSANRAWPSGGGDAAALRVLEILEGLLARRTRPIGVLRRIDSLLPSLAIPMQLPELWDELLEPDAGVLDSSVFGGFAWADSRIAGASALVWTDRDASLARVIATQLADRLAAAGGAPSRWRPDKAVAAGLATGGRFALLDPADDPQAGGMADTPGLLQALLPTASLIPAAFGVLYDPATVMVARQAGPGAVLQRDLGAAASDAFGAPVHLEVEIERIVEAGEDAAGTLVVLRHRLLRILVCERRPSAIGLNLFARAGIMPQDIRMLGAKTGMAIDFELGEHFPEMLSCACPGPASTDLSQLPYQYVPAQRRTS